MLYLITPARNPAIFLSYHEVFDLTQTILSLHIITKLCLVLDLG